MLRVAGLLVLSAIITLAADISGAWIFDVNLDAGSGSPSFELKQSGEALTGKYIGMFGEAPLKGTVKGNQMEFSFKLDQGGESITVTYKGVIESNDAMKGDAVYGSMASGTWKAKRKN